eukprot:403359986
MSDSSIDGELFGQEFDQQTSKSALNFEQPPHYISNSDFQQFINEKKTKVNSKHGYIQCFFYRQFYFPGQTVRGFALIDLFNPINSNKVIIRVRGKEIPGKHANQISQKLKKDPDSFMNHRQVGSQPSVVMDSMNMKNIIGDDQQTLNMVSYKANKKQVFLNVPTPNRKHDHLNNSKTSNMFDSGQFSDLKIRDIKDAMKLADYQQQVIESAANLSKRKHERPDTNSTSGIHSIPLFDQTVIGFQFKDQVVPKGQYKLPFAFRLPSRIPGSFAYQSKNGEKIMIQYTIDVYFEKYKNVMRCKQEFQVREFLFTGEEIDEDHQNFENLRSLKHVLKPVASVAQMMSLEEQHFADDSKKMKALMKSQAPQGLSNSSWSLDQAVTSSRCLCFRSNYMVQLGAQLNKQMFYPFEQIHFNIEVDNTLSERNIEEIQCTLTHNINIKKGQKVIQSHQFDLKLLELAKEGVQKKQKLNRKEFIFDLEKIIGDFEQLERCQDKIKKSQIIQQMSFRQAKSENTLGLQNKGRRDSQQSLFERQLSKFIDETVQFTFLTVNGQQINSQQQFTKRNFQQ